jgi:hypothetical protein
VAIAGAVLSRAVRPRRSLTKFGIHPKNYEAGAVPLLAENSVQIAWDYLERSGELGDACTAGRFLAETIAAMVKRGERRKLMLSNKAIDAYRRFRGKRYIEPVHG